MNDQEFMKEALKLAKSASEIDEVPVGAVIVKGNDIIATGYNLREHQQCATSHAELIAIQQACKNLNSWRLTDCRLFVTLEPCLMCAGAIIAARVGEVIYGAFDPKGGAMGSLYDLHQDIRLNHHPRVISGILSDESSDLLKSFFKQKRKKSRPKAH